RDSRGRGRMTVRIRGVLSDLAEEPCVSAGNLFVRRGTRIRTAGDVLRYADAALGPSDARALMAVLKSSSLAQGFPVGYPSGHLEYPYRYPALDAVLDRAPPASFASAA